ncbi:MAG: succinate dehydrogenase, hydrophobic membrane anchor protein, partial [Gammaproteobacteria bacterium]
MVTAVTNLGRSGLYDWLMQRVTAVILLAYFLYVGCVL